ncbi:hypothetical protein KOR42_37150 [Thalassoglobus neptunius]|uniref:Uncharacterized protein n=1 Tax=Thalassoglobus neptunius TaxID=1938619 RepID=A0A5C5WJ36_9PLAN|nr:hypothetical protein [Thalassoglobus neptunius]TWT50031.1 hypothetical protein KOR42_37150 [Thalassoglobus neptunius]
MKYQELIVLIPCHSLEDFPTELGEEAAASLLNGFSILWHPQLLASSGTIPKWQRSDDTLPIGPDHLIVVPTPCDEWVPTTWVERARREGAVVISGESDRETMLHQALSPLELEQAVDSDLVADFLALGTIHLQIELLTRHMRNFSHIEEVHLKKEALAAAQAAVAHDMEATRKHLKHCFEMLLECRERFYPVDCFLIDLCLVNPDFAGSELQELSQQSVPVNLLASGSEWRTIADANSDLIESLKEGVKKDRVELLGGELEELPSPLMSLDATLWQFESGRAVFQELFGTMPTTWARKRFGIGCHLPQILDRYGYRGALHVVIDDGIYPDEEQTKLRWEGCDGTAIDAFSRIPLAADSASSFLRFAIRMSESMDYDHTAAVALARWPKLRSPWMNDLRRAQEYAPVLGKFTTFTDFFSTSDSPGRLSDFRASGYFTLDLIQSVAREQENPISRWTQYWTRWRKFENLDWCQQISQLLTKGLNSLPQVSALEAPIESAHPEAAPEAIQAANEALDAAKQNVSEEMKRLFTSQGKSGAGLLIVNPASFARKSLIRWVNGVPGESESIIEKQIQNDSASATVKLPPCGFVWLSASNDNTETQPGKTPMAEGLILRNEQFEVHLSDVTGGVAAVRTYRRSPNRLSQQIAYRFPHERSVVTGEGEDREILKTYYSNMVLRDSKVISAGPLIGEIETSGELLDPQTQESIAAFTQRTRVVRGRPNVDIRFKLNLHKVPDGDPWTNYLACRFAWMHSSASLTASMQQGAHAADKLRIEAPHYLEIADDDYRTTILTPGLPFHRMTGDRMLDTLLVTQGETCRDFEFSIAIDQKFPMKSAVDAFQEPIVIPVDSCPPQGEQQGWLFHIGAPNVLLTRILPHRSDETTNSFIIRLLETEGRPKSFPLRCFQTPAKATQVDFLGKSIHTLKVHDDEVHVEIAPYEICDIELTF